MTRTTRFLAVIATTAAAISGVAEARGIEIAVDRGALNNPDYVEMLYEEIVDAAHRACRRDLRNEQFRAYLMEGCVADTVEETLADIDAPLLYSYAYGGADYGDIASR